MLQICSYREVSRENMHSQQAFLSPCKLQTLNLISVPGFYDKFPTRVFLGFNSKLQIPSKIDTLLHTRINTSVRYSVSNSYDNNKKKKKRYGGVLPSILKSLDSEDDIDKSLSLYYGKLSPKEQTVILKELRNWEKVVGVFEWIKSHPDYVPNVIHYNVVLRVLGRARKWDELRRCWIDMANKGVFPSNNTYGMLVDVYGKAGLVKEALLWIKHMKVRGIFPDEVTMNTVVRVLKDGGEYDRADRFYKDWCVGKVELDDLDLDSMVDSESGSSLEPISLTRFLLTELFRTGGRDHTKSWVRPDTENSVQKPRLTATYNTLIDLYGKAGRLKDAADVFAEMLKSGIAMDTITFNTMIFICGSHGNLSEAEALLSKMEERGISPDTKTYNIFLSLYADNGNIDEALQCYKMIREVGLFPDAVTHRAVLQILSDRKMVDEVETVIKEIEKSGLCINKQSLPLVVKMYVDKGLTECAKLLFEKCQKNGGLSSKTYAAVIDAYAQKGLWAEAEYVFSCEREKDIMEYNVMIKAYGIAKLYDKAFMLFKGMKSQGIWPDECTYNSLIQMFSGGDLVDEARDLLSEMWEAGFKPSCLTFSSIVASYARLRRLSEADEIYKEMMKSGVKPNEVVFGSLINGYAESSELDEALRYFGIMQESGLPANQVVLTSIIKAYSKSGVIEGARMIYKKMKELPGGPDVVASNSMLSLYADMGMVSEAKLIFDYLQESHQADAVSFATMMYVYKNMGMLDEAIEVAEEMKHSGLLTDCSSFNKAMACYATSGELVKCGELLHDMIVTRKLVPTNGTFKVLFTVLKKGGIATEGVEQLEFAYQEGKPYTREAIVTAVFSVLGLHTYALEYFERSMKLESGLDLSVYNMAIKVFGDLGRIDDAFKVFMRMQDEGLEADVVTYIYLVGCYGKAGMLEGVKRVYSKLKYEDIDPNESLFKAVIDAYKTVNRHDLAELVNQEMNLVFGTEPLPDSETENEAGETSVSLFV
uniref:pentatricopeptide repeat-containing protein At1g73710 n=1 Tax=Erigeron canadensis TaxID=72917 RepID=UPI001CB8CD29|nr:pentatricopeptide repeat-containing protein At1g73710 [Erigeron canadensis]